MNSSACITIWKEAIRLPHDCKILILYFLSPIDENFNAECEWNCNSFFRKHLGSFQNAEK